MKLKLIAVLCCALLSICFAEEGEKKLRIIVFGAHPDDPEYKAGGAAAKWAKLGHHVKLVSVTNCDIGHWQIAGGPLALRRKSEAAAADKYPVFLASGNPYNAPRIGVWR